VYKTRTTFNPLPIFTVTLLLQLLVIDILNCNEIDTSYYQLRSGTVTHYILPLVGIAMLYCSATISKALKNIKNANFKVPVLFLRAPAYAQKNV
jgi:hypothetical protein